MAGVTPETTPHPYDAPASEALMKRAQAVLPGGVSSPVRAFGAVGGTPRFIVSGRGPYVTDADGPKGADRRAHPAREHRLGPLHQGLGGGRVVRVGCGLRGHNGHCPRPG